MKISIWRISISALVLLVVGAYAIVKAAPQLLPDSIRAAFQAPSNLQSFAFLGCSGDWTDENMRPQAWRAYAKDKTTFLLKHPADCGYTIGSAPEAKVTGASVDLSYSMSNESGAVAACYCEYWASFELKSSPDKITKISINGVDARLMGGLSGH